MSSARISVEVDPSRLRPVDLPDIVADTRRLRERTGWRPEIPLDQTLRDVLADARDRVRHTRD
jgi:GDP-4-dehydro-6-deoxy-D-mannose reductase